MLHPATALVAAKAVTLPTVRRTSRRVGDISLLRAQRVPGLPVDYKMIDHSLVESLIVVVHQPTALVVLVDNWFEDDSALNTEAFKMYEGDDDDSIFSDLKSVDEASKTDASKESADESDSKASKGNYSKYSKGDISRFSRGDISKYSRGDMSKYSRGDVSRYSREDVSRFSRGDVSRYSRGDVSRYSRGDLSRYSRGDMSAFYSVRNDGPFACIDEWLE